MRRLSPHLAPDCGPRLVHSRKGLGGSSWGRVLFRASANRQACVAALAAVLIGCAGEAGDTGTLITFPASAVGEEAQLLERQLERFMLEHPGIRIEPRRTPDAADQRHQLYVQWLNAGAGDPDILQLDVIWTPEFAAAGWILPLDGFEPDIENYFPATVAANRWAGELFALPWFVDVGMLYWRTDLLEAPPATFEELSRQAMAARREAGSPFGFVWQGARYEGLVTVFLEHLGGFGGRIMDDAGRVAVDSDAALRALRYMVEQVDSGVVPQAVLTWHEEQSRFAFQNGRAAFMRNWPYAYPLMQDSGESRVAGRFAVAPMPVADSAGTATAALGGSQLAINVNTEQPAAAYALIEYLTRPEQMLERARVVGQYPTRPSLYDEAAIAEALPVPPGQARRIIESAVPRPVTPVYTQLSEILQIQLHRALTGQQEPEEALRGAAREMSELLQKVGLSPGASGGERDSR